MSEDADGVGWIDRRRTAVEVVAVEGEAEAATAALIRVVARPPGAEEVRFAFDLSRAEAGLVWETDGVRIEC